MALAGAQQARQDQPSVQRAGLALGAAIIVAFVLILVFSQKTTWTYPALAVLGYYALSLIVSGCPSPFQWAVGADGKLSVSKFQFLIWNATVVFSYIWIFSARYEANANLDGLTIPHYVLYAMGFSIGTLALAKGITVSYLNAGRVSKPPDPTGSRLTDLVAQDDGETPDLVKSQMLLWTVIAVVVYMAETVKAVNAAATATALPNIDQTLMILMGLGQAAYLGNKLVSSDVPILTSVSPAQAAPGDKITIAGNNLWGIATAYFDEQQIDVQSVPKDALNYQLTVAAATPKKTVQVSIAVDGVKSANALPLTIT